jgi:hypothetical protein
MQEPDDEINAAHLKFFQDNKKTLLSQLGASLSDRAEGMFRQWLKKQKRNLVVMAPRTKRPKIVQAKPSEKKNRPARKMLTLPKLK